MLDFIDLILSCLINAFREITDKLNDWKTYLESKLNHGDTTVAVEPPANEVETNGK